MVSVFQLFLFKDFKDFADFAENKRVGGVELTFEVLFSSLFFPPGHRVLSYVKRLLQLCLSTTNASFTCGVLFLISEVGKHQETLQDHLQNLNIVKAATKEEGYDATKRDPCHAHAETTPLWELSMLEEHYHPSVRSFASSLRSEEAGYKIVYSGDPLLDFSTSSFLERFSYRNPKQKDLASISRDSGAGTNLYFFLAF